MDSISTSSMHTIFAKYFAPGFPLLFIPWRHTISPVSSRHPGVWEVFHASVTHGSLFIGLLFFYQTLHRPQHFLADTHSVTLPISCWMWRKFFSGNGCGVVLWPVGNWIIGILAFRDLGLTFGCMFSPPNMVKDCDGGGRPRVWLSIFWEEYIPVSYRINCVPSTGHLFICYPMYIFSYLFSIYFFFTKYIHLTLTFHTYFTLFSCFLACASYFLLSTLCLSLSQLAIQIWCGQRAVACSLRVWGLRRLQSLRSTPRELALETSKSPSKDLVSSYCSKP